MVKLSIIVPVFNQEKFLEECICSLLAQDYEDYEIILINDGSTDSSGAICSRYAGLPKIKYVEQSNMGLGPARNTGIEAAAGSYIMFVDSDDALERNVLACLMRFTEKNGFDVVYFDQLICDADLNIRSVHPIFPYMCTRIDKTDALEHCLNPAHVWSKIYKKTLFDEMRFQNMWYEDMELFPKLISIAGAIGYFKVPVYRYRQHKNAITSNNTDSSNRDVMTAWNGALDIEALNPEGKNALRTAVLSSVATFCFFKSRFARDYISWYEEHYPQLVSQTTGGKIETEEISPFEQQAECRDIDVWNTLQKIRQSYKRGGTVIIGAAERGKAAFEKPGLYFQLTEDGPRLRGIHFEAGSQVIGAVLEAVKNQNLISLSGTLKKGILDQLALRAGMLYHSHIYMLEEEA